MVQVGELQIKGSIDTASIDAGTSRIRRSLQSVKADTQPVTGELTRMSGALKGIAGAFAGIATSAGAGLLGLVTGAPALAGNMARIKVETIKLRDALAGGVKPEIDAITSLFGRFVDKVQEFPKTAGRAALFGGAGAAIGGLIGSIFPGIGTIVGAGIGAAVGTLTGAVTGFAEDKFGKGIPLRETEFGQSITGFIENRFEPSPALRDTRVGQSITGAIGGVLDFFKDRAAQLFNFTDSVWG